MAALHVLEPKADTAADASLSDLICQSELEREVLAVLRRLDEETQVGALLALQAIEREVSMARDSTPGR